MQPDLDGYLASLKLERGLSRTTVESYAQDLRMFADFCRERGAGDLGQATPALIREFLQRLREAGLPPRSRRGRVDAVAAVILLRSYLGFASGSAAEETPTREE